MTEFWFDTATGDQLIGQAAAAMRMEQSGPTVVPLPELITTENFPYKNGDYTPLDSAGWSREDCIAYGGWVLRLLDKPDAEPVNLTRTHLERLYHLGIGPSRFRLEEHFDTVWQFREALNVHPGDAKGRYDDWSQTTFTQAAAKLARKLGRKPTEPDYRAAYKEGDSPSVHIIEQRCGGIRKLNERIGYPNIHDWDPGDYIEWGTKVVRANGDISAPIIAILSRRKRGPSPSITGKYFGTLANFFDEVDTALTAAIASEQRLQLTHTTAYDKLVDENVLQAPEGPLAPTEKACTSARYWVARATLPNHGPSVWATLARAPNNRLIHEIRRRDPLVTAGKIELAAISQGTFDLLWPIDEWRTHLLVTEEELHAARARRRAYVRPERSSKR